MSDEEFLDYCDTHSGTPRAGFVPEQIARLLRLAGREADAAKWDDFPMQVVSCPKQHIQPLTIAARRRMGIAP